MVFANIYAICWLNAIGKYILQFGKISPPFQPATMWMDQYYWIISEVDVTVILALS